MSGARRILGEDLEEAGSLAFRLGDDLLAICFRELHDPLRLAAGFRHDVRLVGVRFIDDALLVLTRPDRIEECLLHLGRRLGVLHVHARDVEAASVAVEDLLDEHLRLGRHRVASLGDDEVHAASPDDFTYRALGRLAERDLGIDDIEEESGPDP